MPPARPPRAEDPRATVRFAEQRVEKDDGYLLTTLPREALKAALSTGLLRIPGRRPVRLNEHQRTTIGRLVQPAVG